MFASYLFNIDGKSIKSLEKIYSLTTEHLHLLIRTMQCDGKHQENNKTNFVERCVGEETTVLLVLFLCNARIHTWKVHILTGNTAIVSDIRASRV